jgi:lipopolysaccharide/colanic/teichoic acid biosynthesis glycosyltransferase
MGRIIPSSRASFTAQVSIVDASWAAVAPFLALFLRDTVIPPPEWARTVALYWAVCLVFSLVAFFIFRLRDGLMRYFSVHDALDVVKAVVFAELLICIALFSFNRLEGIPRSIPFIHGLVLLAGLLTARALARLFEFDRSKTGGDSHRVAEHIIIIGSNYLSSLLIKLFGAHSPTQRRVIAALDDGPAMIGRAIAGVPVLGGPQDLLPIIDEFAIHGVRVDRVVVGGGADLLSEAMLGEVRRACEQRKIKLEFLSQMLALGVAPAVVAAMAQVTNEGPALAFFVPSYFRAKRLVDFFAAAAAIVFLLPLFLCVSGLVLLDVGSPVLFRQLRQGRGGRAFLIYKFRTMRAPYDLLGKPTPEPQLQSLIGHMLRRTGLDELPQLFNVLIGDMSLIGPRPLLPKDQPPNPTIRLMVRPGITGWAQVNGAKLLTPEEKDQLDEWYIRNASLSLDLRIVALTLQYVFAGQRRTHRADFDARARGDRRKDSRDDYGVGKVPGPLAREPVRRSAIK